MKTIWLPKQIEMGFCPRALQQIKIVERQSVRDWGVLIIVSLVVVGLRIGSETTANLSYVVLAAYAFYGRAQAVQALALSWLVTMVNPGLAPTATLGAAGRYLVMFSAAASVAVRGLSFSGWKVNWLSIFTLWLGVFFLTHALVVSPVPDVSALKAISWVLVIISVVSAWTGLIPEERKRLEEQLFAGLVIVLVLSLPLLLLAEGYLRNGRGFQGILNHPQAFGAAMALLGAWAVGRFLGEKRPAWSLLVLAVASLVLVVLSEARTAGFAMVIGVGIAAIMLPFLAGQRPVAVLPGLMSRRFQIVAMLAIVGVIVAGPILNELVATFISKSKKAEATGVFEAYEQSRGVLIRPMIENIRQDPWLGIGFGVASNASSMVINRDPFLGLPVGAAVEKGVMPLAVLEEVGILGLLFVLLWVWMVLRRSALGGMAPMAVVVTILLINLGESVLFSPGGMGLLQLVLLGWAVVMGFEGKGANRITR